MTLLWPSDIIGLMIISFTLGVIIDRLCIYYLKSRVQERE